MEMLYWMKIIWSALQVERKIIICYEWKFPIAYMTHGSSRCLLSPFSTIQSITMCTAVTVITVGSKPLEWWMVEAWEGNCCLYVSIDSGSLTHRWLLEEETLQSLQPYRSTRDKIHQKMDTLPFSHTVLVVAMQNNIWISKPNTMLPLDLWAQAHWFFSKSNCSLFPTPYAPAVSFWFTSSRIWTG